MSHYATTPKLQVKGLEELVAALRHMGLTIEVYPEQPVILFDWHGKQRPERAHVVIRRRNTGLAASNDIGFLREADGSITAIISDYDSARYNANWLQHLTKECGVQRAILRAGRLGHRVTRTTDKQGRPRLEIVGRW